MPSPKDVPETPDEATEFKPTGFTNGLAWKKVKYRDVLYHLTELDIGTYDEISTKATRSINRDGVEVEEIDNQLQSRLMLKAALLSPKLTTLTGLGTRLTIALNRVVNELHYGDEPDELKAEAAAPEAPSEGKRPNG